MINEGYNEELDILRSDMTGGTAIISSIENAERERTGIKTLKVRYNKVFGYYIEVTNSFLDKVPEDYIRKQTLAAAERFVTEELKTLEKKILGAEESAMRLEYRLFIEIRTQLSAALDRLSRVANAMKMLDALVALAQTAAENDYVRWQKRV